MRPKQQHESDNCWQEPRLRLGAVCDHRIQQKPNHREKVQPRDDPDRQTGRLARDLAVISLDDNAANVMLLDQFRDIEQRLVCRSGDDIKRLG